MTVAVSICVCTYRRASVARTLASLQRQSNCTDWMIEIAVIDNDPTASAQTTVEHAAQHGPHPVRYIMESRRGLAHARNRGLDEAKGDWLAMIDDDEIADDNWLAELLTVARGFNATATIGTVLPLFEALPAEWVLASRIFDASLPPTGTLLTMGDAKSGNALIDLQFARGRLRFSEEFNRTGGEDTDFFRRMLDLGGRIVSAPDAVVREVVPASRLTRHYILQRSLREGQIHARITCRYSGVFTIIWDMLHAVVNVGIAAGLVIASLPAGKAVYFRYYVLLIRNLGKFRHYMGFSPLQMY